MSTSLTRLADNIGTTPGEIKDVLSGMIISAKAQHGAVATDAELTVVSGICAQYDLNPLTREAHAFISGGKLSVVIGIDGWIKICNRQPSFNGIEYEYEFDGKELLSVTTKIHIKGRDFPVCVTEWMDECYQPKSPAWQKFKKRMLRNKSTGQAVRIAFGVTEVIDDDEKSRIVDSSPAEKNITPTQQGPTTEEIDLLMAECGDLETLKQACSELRVEMQNNGTWKARSAEVIALNVKHKDRINSYVDVEIKLTGEGETSAVIDENGNETGEVSTGYRVETVEGELMDSEQDIGFGEDETDEFGEAKQ